MRFFTSVKCIFYGVASFILLLTYFSMKHFNKSSETILNNTKELIAIGIKKKMVKLYKGTTPNSEMKYILRWTSLKNYLAVFMGIGQEAFVNRSCEYTNCFVTSDRSYLGGVQKFDVIVFAGVEVVYYAKEKLPETRSSHQKYVFAIMESSDRFPICSDYLNDFFNWTWTYKINSDARWGYIAVRDSNGILIGPNSIMHWTKFEDMKPVSAALKKKLKSKKYAVAWLVTRCYSRSKREIFVKELQNELAKYKLSVDIYGKCGPLKCLREYHKKCLEMLDKNYYFYLSFENSFAEDYVTEKILHALQHNTVPIVYGGANYTRFMPDGMYLNARELGPQKLAEKIYELMRNPEKYSEYFKWQNHYSYHSRNELKKTDDICNICATLNDKKLVERVSSYNIIKWWNPQNSFCNKSLSYC